MNAIHMEMPGIYLVLSWNHLYQDFHMWCHKHGEPPSEISVYIADMKSFFYSQSAAEYDSLLQTVKQYLDASFEVYYIKKIHSFIQSSIGCWVLEANKGYIFIVE